MDVCLEGNEKKAFGRFTVKAENIVKFWPTALTDSEAADTSVKRSQFGAIWIAKLDRFVEMGDESILKLVWEVEIASEPPAMIRPLKPKLWFVGELEMQRGCFYKLV